MPTVVEVVYFSGEAGTQIQQIIAFSDAITMWIRVLIWIIGCAISFAGAWMIWVFLKRILYRYVDRTFRL